MKASEPWRRFLTSSPTATTSLATSKRGSWAGSRHRLIHTHRPTDLDALLFAHLVLIRSTPLPSNPLKDQLDALANLVSYVDRIHAEYFA
jgi:hypothetical protein